MTKYIDDSFKNIRFIGLKDSLNLIFKDKNISYNFKNKTFNVRSVEILKEKEVLLEICFKISENNTYLEEIKIECYDKDISEFDLEIYYLKEIFKLLKTFEEENETDYVVRVYKKILTDIGFNGQYTVNFDGTKITFKNLFDERKNPYLLTERIIVFDCKIRANSLNRARSKALNKVREFTMFLSIILDIGFFDINGKYIHIARVIENGDMKGLSGEYRPTGFVDNELGLIVRDNLNQLIPISGLSNNKRLSFFTLNDTMWTSKEDKSNDILLEKIFKGRKMPKVNMNNNYYSQSISEDILLNSEVQIPKNINIYYKNIATLDLEVRRLFFNSCKLYNISSTYGLFEPTLQLSYLVCSIDCLIRADNRLNNIEINKKDRKERCSYSDFVKLYLEEDYNKELCDYLYEHVRNGHFHCGDSYFLEDDLDLDLKFNNSFADLFNKIIEAKKILRKVIIRWIYKNIINKELRDEIITLKKKGLDDNMIAETLNIEEEFLKRLL